MLGLALYSSPSLANQYLGHSIKNETIHGYDVTFNKVDVDIAVELENWTTSIAFIKTISNDHCHVFGAYLQIKNSEKEVIFNNIINAPYLLINLLPGRYYLTATYDSIDLHANFELPAESIMNIVFDWI